MEDRDDTGWGVRTMAEGEGPYNPIEYHCGTCPNFRINGYQMCNIARFSFVAGATSRRPQAPTTGRLSRSSSCWRGCPHERLLPDQQQHGQLVPLGTVHTEQHAGRDPEPFPWTELQAHRGM